MQNRTTVVIAIIAALLVGLLFGKVLSRKGGGHMEGKMDRDRGGMENKKEGANKREGVISNKEKMTDTQGEKTLAIAQAFLDAAGSGDGETLSSLMTDDFVWHNEGDTNVPWIGNWEGKEKVLGEFMPLFGAGLKVTSWTTDHSFASGDQAVFMGTMSALANNTNIDTGKFSWAVRVEIQGDKVKSWNWFEDSHAVSKAYAGQ